MKAKTTESQHFSMLKFLDGHSFNHLQGDSKFTLKTRVFVKTWKRLFKHSLSHIFKDPWFTLGYIPTQ